MAGSSFTKALRLTAAFAAAAFVAGCGYEDNRVSESYLVKGNATKEQALEAIVPKSGIFYIFDFKNEKVSYVVNDRYELHYGRYGTKSEYPHRIFSVELPLAEVPAVIRAKYDEIKKFQSNVSTNVAAANNQFAVWCASASDPRLNNEGFGAVVVADPFSKLVSVIAVEGNQSELSGTVGDIKNYPQSVQAIYRRQLNLDPIVVIAP